MQKRTAIIALFSSIILSGCKNIVSGIAYETDIPQGNVVTMHEIEKLAKGMTKDKVTFLIGTPVAKNLTKSSKLEYVYLWSSKYKASEFKKLTLTFEKDILTDILYEEGD